LEASLMELHLRIDPAVLRLALALVLLLLV
jgi:hypothetical protein